MSSGTARLLLKKSGQSVILIGQRPVIQERWSSQIHSFNMMDQTPVIGLNYPSRKRYRATIFGGKWIQIHQFRINAETTRAIVLTALSLNASEFNYTFFAFEA